MAPLPPPPGSATDVSSCKANAQQAIPTKCFQFFATHFKCSTITLTPIFFNLLWCVCQIYLSPHPPSIRKPWIRTSWLSLDLDLRISKFTTVFFVYVLLGAFVLLITLKATFLQEVTFFIKGFHDSHEWEFLWRKSQKLSRLSHVCLLLSINITSRQFKPCNTG